MCEHLDPRRWNRNKRLDVERLAHSARREKKMNVVDENSKHAVFFFLNFTRMVLNGFNTILQALLLASRKSKISKFVYRTRT